MHYGKSKDDGAPGRGSGRYPKGSGDNPYQHLHRSDFIVTANMMKKEGFSDKEIAEYFFGEGASPSEYRRRLANAKADEKQIIRAQMIDLYNQGYGYSEIGRALGKSESTVRSMLDPIKTERAEQTAKTAELIAKQVSDTNYIDIGPGTENVMGITRTKLQLATQRLVDSGDYELLTVYIPQAAVKGANTTMQVLVPAGTTKREVLENRDRINPVFGYHSEDNGKTWYGIEEPANFDSKRLKVRYNEEGGINKDGVIELRRGVKELDMGGANYAQVRIAVDGTHYLKGMAVYSDDMPDGIDIVFNTNKHVGTPVLGEDSKHSVLKPLKDDHDNPFGSMLKTDEGVVVGQRKYEGEDGKLYLSPVNIVREEGDWNTWSRNLASQFLSKQSPALAKRQLNEAAKMKEAEFEEISALTNPEIKKKLLDEFADSCDSAAVHLKAAAMPRQATKVILPIPDLKENEIYAPTYNDGEEVILVRYPHGGTFEIPRLIVNNSNANAKSIIGNAIDAVGIHPKAAAKLSGADFDGDTVLVIPTKNQKLNSKTPAALMSLQDFDPKEVYGTLPDGYPKVGKPVEKGGDGFNTQTQMGIISNLITDMTIKKAPDEEIARAVRHSMVVIDAEKHQLNWRQSELDNNISELKNKYQAKEDLSKPGGGASTLLSRATSEERVPKRKEVTDVSIMTPEEKEAWYAGKKVYRNTGEMIPKKYQIKDPSIMTDKELERYNSGKKVYRYNWYEITDTSIMTPKEKQSFFAGKKIYRLEETDKPRTIESTKMAEVSDAHKLSSGQIMEEIYADHANRMKALANEARKEMRSTPNSKYDPQAAKVYAKEVSSLMNSLNNALKNKPLERRAQLLANIMVEAKKADNPDMDYDEIKKITAQSLNQARATVGANKKSVYVPISEKEWEAIQAHALSSSKVQQILANTDEEKFKQLATPHDSKAVSERTASRIETLYNTGKYTLSEIAEQFGVSPSTVSQIVNGGDD